MLRVIVEVSNAGMAVNVGGSVHTSFKTFDIEAPELEAFLGHRTHDYEQRQVAGVELLP